MNLTIPSLKCPTRIAALRPKQTKHFSYALKVTCAVQRDPWTFVALPTGPILNLVSCLLLQEMTELPHTTYIPGGHRERGALRHHQRVTNAGSVVYHSTTDGNQFQTCGVVTCIMYISSHSERAAISIEYRASSCFSGRSS